MPTTHEARDLGGSRGGAGRDAAWLGAVTVALLACYLSTYVVHAYAFPVGPDAPVYLWWARLAGHDGLSAVAGRPGVPALTLVLGGTLGAGTASTVAALEVVLAVCVGLGGAAVAMRDRAIGGRAAWVVAGLLAGLFAAHLALGYVATLAAAALFLAAAGAIGGGTRTGTLAGAALLAASGFAHPEFLAVEAAVLLVAAALAWARVRRGGENGGDHRRILASLAGGAALFGVGAVTLLVGPPPLLVDTSRDDFLQRAGLGAELVAEFRERVAAHAYLWVPAVAVPLAILGGVRSRGFVRRLLAGWGIVLVGGGVVAYVTGAFPAERLATFAFAVPVAAGIGLVVLWRLVAGDARAIPRVALASTVLALFGAAMAAGALLDWERTPPKLFPTEVERVTEAGRYAEATPPGTRLVFTATNGEAVASFFATEAANAIRAAIPPDRIRDVVVVEPAGFDLASLRTDEGRRLVDLSQQDAFGGLPPNAGSVWFDLAPFDRTNYARPFGATGPDDPRLRRPVVVSQGVAFVGPHPPPVAAPVEPLAVTSAAEIALASAGILALLALAGYGWARAALGGGTPAVALAPGFGAGALMLVAIAADRVGVPLAGRAGPVAVTLVATAGGVAAAAATRRRERREPAPA